MKEQRFRQGHTQKTANHGINSSRVKEITDKRNRYTAKNFFAGIITSQENVSKHDTGSNHRHFSSES
jgi:hypothetical protein